MDVCSPNELFDHILPYDGNVELIGKVDSEEWPRYCNVQGVQKLRYRVVLTNGHWKVQLTIWDESLINKLRPLFNFKNIVHLDGIFSQERNERYSLGNVSVDLTYKSNSSVAVYTVLSNAIENMELYKSVDDMENILDYDKQLISVTGHLKSAFSDMNIGGTTQYIASLAIKQWRLEVRCQDSSILGMFEVQSKLRIFGEMQGYTFPYYLKVKYVDHIITLPGTISMLELRHAVCVPKKRKISQEENQTDCEDNQENQTGCKDNKTLKMEVSN